MPGTFPGALFERNTLQNSSSEISICRDVLSLVYSLLPGEGIEIFRQKRPPELFLSFRGFAVHAVDLSCRAAGFSRPKFHLFKRFWEDGASEHLKDSWAAQGIDHVLFTIYIWSCCAHSRGAFLLFFSSNAVFVFTLHLECLEFARAFFSLWANKLRHCV